MSNFTYLDMASAAAALTDAKANPEVIAKFDAEFKRLLLTFTAELRSDILSRPVEDGNVEYESFYVIARNARGDQYVHWFSSEDREEVENLVARMNRKGIQPKDNDHWRFTTPVYGSPAHEAVGDDPFLTKSERYAALGMPHEAEKAAREEDENRR